ncbi:MAG: cardiolipin synthase [Bdellovibrio sp.]|nr:cardiolipin synthase [Bdellovibrio sp.]
MTKKVKIVLSTFALTVVIIFLVVNFKSPQKELSFKVKITEPINSPHFARVLGNLMGPQFIGGNKVVSLYNGEQIFPAMLNAIAAAKKSITFESYIYWSGDIGQKFADALSAKAKKGVKVHLLLDWVGSSRIKDAYLNEMETAGVEIERYHALEWYNISKLNNRTHRKILVIDGEVGFTGGVGIADEWNGNGLDSKKWRDTHYEVRGPVVAQMQAAFMDNWLKTRPDVHHSENYFPDLKNEGKSFAQMSKSSNTEGGSSVRLMYLLAIAAARKSIYLESAYFIPDERTIEDLVRARNLGVDVQIIVPGKFTDSQVLRHASRSKWGELLDAGVKIFEYQPAMFHSKVLIIDNYFLSVGSTNFDERSFRLNDEANLNILDEDLANQELKAFKVDLTYSKEVTLDEWKNRPVYEKLIEQVTTLFHSQL